MLDVWSWSFQRFASDRVAHIYLANACGIEAKSLPRTKFHDRNRHVGPNVRARFSRRAGKPRVEWTPAG